MSFYQDDQWRLNFQNQFARTHLKTKLKKEQSNH